MADLRQRKLHAHIQYALTTSECTREVLEEINSGGRTFILGSAIGKTLRDFLHDGTAATAIKVSLPQGKPCYANS
jgi:hypothetical protein